MKNDKLSPEQSIYLETFGKQPVDLILSQLSLIATKTDYETPQVLVIPPDVLLSELKLDSNEPDGRTLLERLADVDSKSLKFIFRSTADLEEKLQDIETLVMSMEERLAMGEALLSYEEEVMKNLVSVLDRQIVIEGDICPMAHSIALAVFNYRPEYFSDEAQEFLMNSSIHIIDIIPNFEEGIEVKIADLTDEQKAELEKLQESYLKVLKEYKAYLCNSKVSKVSLGVAIAYPFIGLLNKDSINPIVALTLFGTNILILARSYYLMASVDKLHNEHRKVENAFQDNVIKDILNHNKTNN